MMLDSLANVKSYLGISGNTLDAFLTLQIEIISESIEEYCLRKFLKATYIQTYYRDDFDSRMPVRDVLLYNYPLVSIDEILEKDELPEDGTPVLDYRFHLPTARLTKNNGGVFFRDGQILQVTYEAGYETLPAPVKSVLYSLVEERYNKKVSGVNVNFGSDVQRISIPGTISIDYDYSLQSNERKTALGVILGNYVNVLDAYRSERTIIGNVRPEYVE